jgi:AraC-like DNA-binding protein
MRYIEREPTAALSGWVDKLWCLSDAPCHTRERIVPSGTLELVINLYEDEIRVYDAVDAPHCQRFSGAVVSGAYDRFFVIDTREHASVIGVHFKPGGAAPFIGLPASTLANAHVDLETLWGTSARRLRERLCSVPGVQQRFELLEAALSACSSRPFRRHAAVPWAIERLDHGASVAEVAAQTSLSHRRLIEVFADHVGMRPKAFARVLRFQRMLASSESATPPDWANLAALGGYCDQSHLIRDFVAFSGLSPGELRRCRGVPLKVNHVAVMPPEAGSNSSNTSPSSGPKIEL